jgi:hypothetical protein
VARLQILELPEGAGDDRPPFVLVIDEVAEEESERVIDSREAMDGMAKKMGARAVAVFHGMTVDIPANSSAPVSDDPERAGTTEIVHAHERTRLDLCAALLVSGDTTWRKLVETVTERQKAIARIYNLPEQPDGMDAKDPNLGDFLQGYGNAIRKAKRAARDGSGEGAEDTG